MKEHHDHFEDEYRTHHDQSALDVARGVEQQPSVNPRFNRIARPKLSTDDYVRGIAAGDTGVLSQAITLIESSNPSHYRDAQQIIERVLPLSGRSLRIGITGVPGAGKSTFIEAVGGHVVKEGHKLAVLAIDPSSSRTGGSILGDKTRMETISSNPKVFIRPSPSAGSLGGVARKTRESVVLCEAAGYDVIFIETVGVGQSETAVKSMVDLFMLLQIAGAGDELQGIKRGIMEMADLIVVNKADGDNVLRAELAKTQITSALHLFPPSPSGVEPQVLTCSAVAGNGVEEVWHTVVDTLERTRANGFFESNRHSQGEYWLHETIDRELRSRFYDNPEIAARLVEQLAEVRNGVVTPFTAAQKLLEEYEKLHRNV